MKRYIIPIVMLLAAGVSCSKSGLEHGGEAVSGKECLVSFNAVGEISTSESPLSKGGTLTDDIYCVQVYEGTSPFAFGYFDNLESMKLYLKQGAKYRIIVSLVKDAKNLLGERYLISKNSLRNYGFDDIYNFKYKETNSSSYSYSSMGDYSYAYYPINYYQYSFLGYCRYCYSGGTISEFYTSWLLLSNIEKAILNTTKYPTCKDWFYGEVNDYSPTGDYETLNLDFKRVGFKLKYELSGVTDGEVTVVVKNSTREFINNTTNTSTYSSDTQFIAFYDAKSAWQYADNYTENLDVSVTWKRGIGVTQDLGTKTIQVKRNCLNNIKIALGSDDRNGSLNMSLESESSMGNANTDIPVE